MEDSSPVEKQVDEDKSPAKKPALTKLQLSILGAIVTVGVLIFGAYTYVYGSTPDNIKNPKLEHAHLRMQYFVDGTPVDFGADEYQQEYKKNQCSAEFPKQPIHFHDNLDQFIHLHWKGVTGAQVLGYYGNDIGGINDMLGSKQTSLTDWETIPIHSDSLPGSTSSNTWVYSKDENGLVKRELSEFLTQDLETFFGSESSFKTVETSFLDSIFPIAHAEQEKPDESELARIQNLIGDVVVFVQDTEPTVDQLSEAQERFIQLDDSVCGG